MSELTLRKGAEPFFFPGNDTGCLVVHGFTGAPYEMRWLGEHLCGQGWTVYGPRLAGHGTAPQDLARVRWREWYFDVLAGYEMLRRTCSRIVVAGLSMGGALALLLASEQPVDGLVTLSALYELDNPLKPLLPLADVFVDTIPKGYDEAAISSFDEFIRQEQIRRGEEPFPRPSYRAWVVPALRQVLAMLKVVRAGAPRITAPALLVHSKADKTVSFDNLQKIYDAIGSAEKRMIVLEESGHVCTQDVEYPLVFDAVTGFIRALS